MLEAGKQIVGIKRVQSSNGRLYVTYYCQKPFTDYELEKYETEGLAVEEVLAQEDFGINCGDVVEFYYDKAHGDYQPAVMCKVLQKNPLVDKDKK